MKKAALFAFLILCTALLATSCMRKVVEGHGYTTTQVRTVDAFTAIDFSFPVKAEIIISPGATPTVELTSYENVLSYIKTDVKGNTLHITGAENVNLEINKDVLVRITVGSLSELDISGAAEANITGAITGQKFSLDASGAAEIVIAELRTTELSVDLSGAGAVVISNGAASTASYDLSGAAEVKAFGLQTETAKVEISGMGDVELSVSQKLTAEISGAGEIKYRGSPQVQSDISGAGEINKVD